MLMRVFGFIGVLIILACRCVHADPPHDAPSIAVAPGHGYALIYDLMGDERNVSKLLIVKRGHPELGTLIKRISSICGEAQKQLETFAKTMPEWISRTWDCRPLKLRPERNQPHSR